MLIRDRDHRLCPMRNRSREHRVGIGDRQNQADCCGRVVPRADVAVGGAFVSDPEFRPADRQPCDDRTVRILDMLGLDGAMRPR
jgi:hypothetical protein